MTPQLTAGLLTVAWALGIVFIPWLIGRLFLKCISHESDGDRPGEWILGAVVLAFVLFIAFVLLAMYRLLLNHLI